MQNNDTPIIVAYSSPDRELAETIQRDLEMVGFSAFLHSNSNPEIYERMVVVVSEAALADRNLQTTWETALERGKRLCSVRVNSVPLPTELDRAQWVDLALGYQVGFNGLKMALMAAPSEVDNGVDVAETEVMTELNEISSKWIFYSIAIAAGVLIVGVVAVILLLIL